MKKTGMEENEALTTDEQRWTRMWKTRYGGFGRGAEPHTRGAYAPRADDFWPAIRAWLGWRGMGGLAVPKSNGELVQFVIEHGERTNMRMMINWVCGVGLLCLASSVRVGAADFGSLADGEYTIGPEYTNAPETMTNAAAPKGTIHEFVMDSTNSAIYPGLKGPYKRGVWVYVPSQYVAGAPAPFIRGPDGRGYTNPLPGVLDHLTNLP